jgi:hypothetical protein
MAQATLLFYAAATFLLGLLANAAGGANALQSIFDPGSLVIGGSLEPWTTVLKVLTLAIPGAFLAMAVGSIFAHPAEGPATASDLRELVAELRQSSGS